MSASDRSTGGQKASKPAAPAAGRTVQTDGSSSPPAQTSSDNRSNGGGAAAGAAAGIGAGLLAAIIAGLLLLCLLLFGVALIAGLMIGGGRSSAPSITINNSQEQQQEQMQKQKQKQKLCGSCGKSHKGACSKKKKASTTKVQTSTRFVRRVIKVKGKTKVIYVPEPAKDARQDQEGKPETVPNGDDNDSSQFGGDVAPSEETSGS